MIRNQVNAVASPVVTPVVHGAARRRGVDNYLRTDSTSLFWRPGGVSLYKRPFRSADVEPAAWLLETGMWEDAGSWRDTSSWVD